MKAAIIGCGTMGKLHAAMAKAAGVEIAICADNYTKGADDLAREYGAQASHDPMEALAQDGIDIVAIATPTPTHAQYVEAAAKAGKHIFVEKPFTRTVEQAKEAIAATEAAGVKLFVGHVLRYFHEYEGIAAQVAAGKIGKPGYAKFYRGGAYPGPEHAWFRDFEMSGGVTFDCLIHDLDWIRWQFGEPERIYCETLMRTDPEVMDYSQVTMRLKNGFIAVATGTWAHPSGFRTKAEVCGSGGMLTYDSAETAYVSQMRQQGDAPGVVVPSSPVYKSPYQREWEDFAGWLRGEHEPRVTPRDGLRAVEIVSAALESSKRREPVSL